MGRATSSGRGMAWLRRPRIVGYATLLVLAVVLVELLASIVFYSLIDRQTIHEDHARRVAELLVVGDRVQQRNGPAAAGIMSTRHLDVAIHRMPMRGLGDPDADALRIGERILAWEPSLSTRTLMLDVDGGWRGRADLVGSMRLKNGAWLNFRSRDISTSWPIALRARAITVAIAVLCLLAGLYLLHRIGEPLDRLIRAASTPGAGTPMPLSETGASDVRALARSFNSMQSRISTLEAAQAESFEAISHDLRTPLSRLKIASDFMAESDVAQIVRSSADEMEDLLLSLQRFLRAQHIASTSEPVDLPAEMRAMIAAYPDRVTLTRIPDHPPACLHAEPFRLALQPLIDNAVQYGDAAAVTVSYADGGWLIVITDQGPGIPDEYHERILDPFFRLDEARARNTRGFGLGIPTAHQLLRRFGGALSFANGEGGGLVVRVVVPQAAA